MNKLFIPPSINWFESNAVVCAPDNTIVYASRSDVVVIEPRPPEEAAAVKVLPRKHSDRVGCVAVNQNWDSSQKFILSTGDDKKVYLWNLVDDNFSQHHAGHTTHSDRLVGATFAGSDRVISVSENGTIIIWRYILKELNSLNNVLGIRTKVTCISSCPHATWLTAFGLRQGSIIVADLRGAGKIMYRLAGHESKAIISLSWCPAPFNIFPKKQLNIKLPAIENTHKNEVVENSNSKDNILEPNKENVDDEHYVKEHCGQSSSENLGNKQEICSSGGDSTVNTNTEECVSSNTVEVCCAGDDVSVQDIVQSSDKGITEPQVFANLEYKPHDLSTVTVLPQQTNEDSEVDQAVDDASLSLKNSNEKLPILSNDVPVSTNIDVATISPTRTEEDNLITSVLNESELPQNKTSTEASIVIDEDQNSENKEEEQEQYMVEEQEYLVKEPVKEYLLASAVQGGRSIIIWRAGTDGKKETELYFPSKQRGSRSKNDSSTWISLCWIKPQSLLSSSLQNELLEWNLNSFGSKKSSKKWRLIHGDHTGFIFSIVAPFRKYCSIDIEDWRDKNLLNAWTFGKDRIILNTSLSAGRETLTLYPTCSGGILNMISSPLAPNRFAVLSGDGSCRLWDTCRPHYQYIDMSLIVEKFKVTCLSWHPTKDTHFAFGTNEGKVVLMDTSASGKKPTYLVHHFSATINWLEWAPTNGDINNMGLYVLSGGVLASYDISKPLNRPTEINLCDDNSIYCFAWKPDYSALAVGTKTGSLILASRELKCLVSLILQHKCIKHVVWHHDVAADTNNSGTSVKYSNLLAFCSTELKIYDCSKNFSSEPSHEPEGSNYDNIIASFNEHSGVISSVTWNPHQEGIAASASEDGSIFVWNVLEKTLLHCCRRTHLEAVFSVVWSPLDADFIIAGYKDSALIIWKLSENLPKEKISKRVRKKVVNKTNEVITQSQETDSNGLNDSLAALCESKRYTRNVLCGLARLQNNTDMELVSCQKMFDFASNKDSVEDGKNKIDITQIFRSKDNANDLLELEKKYQHKTKCAHANDYIALWQGNFGERIKEAIANETLTPLHVSLAPMVSPNLWTAACIRYAEQLAKSVQADPFQISSYYLACHKVEEAVETLCSFYKFREALALAKVRLLEDDPLINSIIERSAQYMDNTGKYLAAAQCYLGLNRLNDAAKTLFKSFDAETLTLAAEIAKKDENKDLLEAIMYKLTSLKGEESDNADVLPPLPTRGELELNLAKISANVEDTEDSDNNSLGAIVNEDQNAELHP